MAKVWPNVEKLTAHWIRDHTAMTVFTETPDTLEDYLPAVLVARVGGGESRDIDKAFSIEVTVLALTRAKVWEGVQEIETAMSSLEANGTEAWYVDDVVETFGAAMDPNPNARVRRATATYQLTIRPRS